ncbi:MAG TPA: hypothetical protein VNN19_02960 [bacterium]|nr:hypothetical protein [bacterium]
MKTGMAAVLTLVALLVVAAGSALAAQPENPTARAERGSFNKSQTGLDHQSEWAWYYDGPADPRVDFD